MTIDKNTITLKLNKLLDVLYEYKVTEGLCLDYYEMDALLRHISRIKTWLRAVPMFPKGYLWDEVFIDCNEMYRRYQ